MQIALVCGEASGDALGAGLAKALRKLNPDIKLAGVTGPAMRDAGVQSWIDYSPFAIMGHGEAVRRLPTLLRKRKQVLDELKKTRPKVFVGLDAPDLNMEIGRRSHNMGIPYVQYVCPSFWVWRAKRARSLAKSCSKVLALLPFEVWHCKKEKIPAKFVGHRLVDELQPDPKRRAAARKKLGIGQKAKVLALLPGSRKQELSLHSKLFTDVAGACRAEMEGLEVWSAPLEGVEGSNDVQPQWVKKCPAQAVTLLAAADVALVKSGTVTLEAALLGCPQVVAYRLGALSGAMAKWLMASAAEQSFSLPNLILGEKVVPELIQSKANERDLKAAVMEMFEPKRAEAQRLACAKIREVLGDNAEERAARAVLEVAGK